MTARAYWVRKKKNQKFSQRWTIFFPSILSLASKPQLRSKTQVERHLPARNRQNTQKSSVKMLGLGLGLGTKLMGKKSSTVAKIFDFFFSYPVSSCGHFAPTPVAYTNLHTDNPPWQENAVVPKSYGGTNLQSANDYRLLLGCFFRPFFFENSETLHGNRALFERVEIWVMRWPSFFYCTVCVCVCVCQHTHLLPPKEFRFAFLLGLACVYL